MESTLKPTATGLLRDDHRKVEELYRRFTEAQGLDDRRSIMDDICKELELHSRLEECLVYPRLAHDPAEGPLARHFGEEHDEVKRLISEVRLFEGDSAATSFPSDGLLSRMMANVEKHVSEEEGEAFPALEANPERNQELGLELTKLKTKLRMCPPVYHAIDLAVPVRMAYNQWTQFEAFPSFLDSVKEVRQLDDSHVCWRVDIGGKEFQWTAEIYEQIPDQRIAWSSVDGALNAGSASFRPLTATSCRMLVELSYEPQGIVEDLGAMLGLLSRRVATELDKFKAFVESRASESGAWRGRIEGTPVDPELKRQGLSSPNLDPGGGDILI